MGGDSDFDCMPKTRPGYSETRLSRRLVTLRKRCPNIRVTKKIRSILKSLNKRPYLELRRSCSLRKKRRSKARQRSRSKY
jgi:hypothetical protein